MFVFFFNQICLAFLFVIVRVLASPNPGNVLELTESNFSKIVDVTEGGVLVQFYAPWCHHCKEFLPEFESAAKTLGVLNSTVLLAKIDATKEAKLSSRYDIKGYPTLKYFKKNSHQDYKGDRSAIGIVNWVKQITGPCVTHAETKEKATQLAVNQTVSFIARVSSNSSEKLKIFTEYADAHRNSATFIAYVDPQIKSNEETVTVVSDNTEGETHILTTKELLEAFCKRESLPLFGPINARNFESYYASGLSLLWFVGSKEDYLQASSVIKESAKELREKYSFLWLSTTDFPGHAQSALGVAKYPALVAQVKEDKFVYPKNEFTNSTDVTAFIRSVEKGEVEKFLLSEEIPEVNEGPVYVVVGKNFNKMVIRPDKDVFLMVYAPWCGHCKNFAPIYNEFAKKMKNQSNLVVAKIDGSSNESPNPDFVWGGYPTVFFIKAGSKTPIIYSEKRSVEGLQAFLAKHGSKPILADSATSDEL